MTNTVLQSNIKACLTTHTLSITLLFFTIYPVQNINAQERTAVVNAIANLSPEKIYVQTDGKVYSTNTTIWFKAIVTEGISNIPGKTSGILYVELINPKQEVVETKTIKLDHGIGTGYIDVHKNLEEGKYQIRAYTKWNRNFGSAYFFDDYIHIFNTEKQEATNLFSDVRLIENKDGKYFLTAKLDEDGLQDKKFVIRVLQGHNQEDVSFKRLKGQISLKYEVKDRVTPLTLEIKNEAAQFSYSKTFALNKDHLDIQFFPESGKLIRGVPARIGIKVLNFSQRGERVEGELINSRGKVVTYFKSNQLGMGSFLLRNDAADSSYRARVRKIGDTVNVVVDLPKIKAVGYVLTVKKSGSNIRLKANAVGVEDDSIKIEVTSKGLKLLSISGKMKNGVLSHELSAAELPAGVITNTDQPVAERLFFNRKLSKDLVIKLKPDQSSYRKREKTKLTISLKDNGENSNLSVLVINKEQMGSIQSERENILSYFLLNSELKGKIEKPGFYLGNNEDKHKDIDALMLTQGWRNYVPALHRTDIQYYPERNLTVSGTVKSSLMGKPKAGADLVLMSFGEQKEFYYQTADSLGKFSIEVADQYGSGNRFLLQTAKKQGKNKNYTVDFGSRTIPKVSYDYSQAIEQVDTVIYRLAEEEQKRKEAEAAFRLSSGVVVLDEFVVENYELIPIVLGGEEIRAKEEKWMYGLYNILNFKFQDEVTIKKLPGNSRFASVIGGGPTLVIIDGNAFPFQLYNQLQFISPDDIRSVDIIKFAKNFQEVASKVFPNVPLGLLPDVGSLISIHTYSGKGLFSLGGAPVGINHLQLDGFSASKQFYAPKYNQPSANDLAKPDLRALIHWDPSIKTDNNGKASVDYYNSDLRGEVLIIVEAISDNGKIGYQEYTYRIK